MVSFTWTMLCPPESLWVSKQHVLPSVPWAVWCFGRTAMVGYIISVY